MSGWTAGQHGRLLVIGIALTTIGVLLLAPLGVAGPAVVARHMPVAARLALRDLGRYRARSGAVVAAISFSVLLAVLVAILTTARSADPLEPTGPNLAANQVIVYVPHGSGTGPLGYGPPPTPEQARALQSDVSSLASSTRARFALLLYSAGRLDPGGDTPEAGTNQRTQLWRTTGPQEQYAGQLYVATPELLRDFGIDPRRIQPDTDLVTSQPALTSTPHLELIGNGNISERHTPTGQGIPGTFAMRCPPATCIPDPKIQVIADLPTGTSAPTTLITEHALDTLGQQLIPDGWLVQTPGAFTPAEKNAARQVALTSQTPIEVGTGAPDLSTMRRSASVLAILLALAVLAMTVGLIRSVTASDLRILAAAGAGRGTRRTITAATVGALGLTGAIVGTTAAYVGVAVWAHSDLPGTLLPVPARELLAILVALPVLAATGGWLLAGREPRLLTRQPLE